MQSKFYVHSGFILTVNTRLEFEKKKREKRKTNTTADRRGRENSLMLLARTSNQSIPYLLSVLSPSLQRHND